MGDALLFKYNMIQPNGKWIDTNNIQHFLGGLALNQSLGAEICDNIINANILIKNSKGVIFQANQVAILKKALYLVLAYKIQLLTIMIFLTYL